MNRGIPQGCPLSAILYLFIAEILSDRIKNNNSFEWFPYKNSDKEIKHV